MMKRVLHFKALTFLSLILFIGVCFTSCQEDETEEPRIPVISSFSPDEGEPGDDVTITGTDLEDALSVSFGSTPGTIVSNTATEIVATIPEGATTGKISVTTDGGVAISQNDLTVIVIGAVTVSKVSPISAEAGENVVITGTDMATVSSVSVGDVEATVVETTDTTAEVTIPEGAVIGSNTFTIVNEGGTNTTSTDAVEFYVIKTNMDLTMTFDGEQEGVYTGSPDAEESTVYGTSNESAVQTGAQALPLPIDNNFFHFEGYSTTDLSGSYAAIVQNSSAQPAGTYADFLDGATDESIYFNVQINIGNLPEGYDDLLFGLRFRFDGDDYEFTPTPTELSELGFTPDEDGWYNISVPATVFDDDAALGSFDFKNVQRIGIAARRNYGSGGTSGEQVTEEDGGVFYSLSLDNAIVSVGGPYSFPSK